MVLSRCPVRAERQAVCCEGEPFPCQAFALLQGFPSHLLEGSSLLTLWLHPYFLGSFCFDRNACLHLECCQPVRQCLAFCSCLLCLAGCDLFFFGGMSGGPCRAVQVSEIPVKGQCMDVWESQSSSEDCKAHQPPWWDPSGFLWVSRLLGDSEAEVLGFVMTLGKAFPTFLLSLVLLK